MLCAVLSVCLCLGRFVMVYFNLTCLYCLQHTFLEHLFNLYLYSVVILLFEPVPEVRTIHVVVTVHAATLSMAPDSVHVRFDSYHFV